MVYPVSGYPSPQIPAANTFQPGGTDAAVKQRADEKQAQSTDSSSEARTQRLDRSAESNERYVKASESSRSEDSGRTTSSSSRGTQLDVTV